MLRSGEHQNPFGCISPRKSRPVVSREPKRETRRMTSAERFRLLAILPTEADRGRAIVQRVKAHTEGSTCGEHQDSQQCRSSGTLLKRTKVCGNPICRCARSGGATRAIYCNACTDVRKMGLGGPRAAIIRPVWPDIASLYIRRHGRSSRSPARSRLPDAQRCTTFLARTLPFHRLHAQLLRAQLETAVTAR